MATNEPNTSNTDGEAVDLIREKVSRLYSEEPDASKEISEAQHSPHRSKHQQFMYELSMSGKDLATVQTEWHNYYQSLPPNEKHQVWQEFYSSQSLLTGDVSQQTEHAQQLADHKHQAAGSNRTKRTAKSKKLREVRSKKELQQTIRHKVSAGGKLEAKHHVQSLLFGLGMGFLTLVIFLFGFFNEVFIAPFIQPSRTTAATPLIINEDSVATSSTPEVIIPKINVQIPVVYDEPSINEAALQRALERGVIHYPTTAKPGENGNAAFFGHSSNNIFNKGKYKFAFVLLRTLELGDTFYLTNNGKVYAYKVIDKKVVDPTEVGVLNPIPGQTATATLITCDPPGTSLKRMVVVGQQISPDPSGNAEGTAGQVAASEPIEELPGEGPTLLGRTIRSTPGKVIAIALLAGAFLATLRWMNKGAKPSTGK